MAKKSWGFMRKGVEITSIKKTILVVVVLLPVFVFVARFTAVKPSDKLHLCVKCSTSHRI